MKSLKIEVLLWRCENPECREVHTTLALTCNTPNPDPKALAYAKELANLIGNKIRLNAAPGSIVEEAIFDKPIRLARPTPFNPLDSQGS